MTDITLLDGGMGQELIHRAGDRPTPLWSTQVMIDHPGLVEEIHRDYFAAGASVATTNTYAILRDRFVGTPVEDKFEELNSAALKEAQAARKAHGSGRIAGAIGPLGATYRSDKHPAAAQAAPVYAEKISLLQDHCDVILFETVASLEAAQGCLEGAAECNLPIWLSVTVNDDDGTRLRNGDAVADLEPLLQGRAAAVLANCSLPEAMPAALAAFTTMGVPFGAYANGFTRISEGFLEDKPTVDALQARSDLTPERYADHVMSWVAQGATIVGGCCETGPAHIAEIRKRLTAAGPSIV